MAKTFKTPSANKMFGQFKEPDDAGNYVLNKKAQTVFCGANQCTPSITVNTQGNLILLKKSNHLKYYNKTGNFNKANLNINLVTTLDLSSVPVIQQNTPLEIPAYLDTTAVPYLAYTIDPSGNLFGNTICGTDNFQNYLRFNPPYTTTNPGYINSL